jgi:hypothetical protein
VEVTVTLSVCEVYNEVRVISRTFKGLGACK